ncbi:MAG: hypothetical protein K2X87_12765 [Gemmataceae bacterium]|nr:hypothetical protein [Gemmataceae bacterium]
MVRRSLLAAAVLAAAVPLARPADPPPLPDGLYRLSTVNALGEGAVCVLKVETKGGTPSAAVVASPPTAAVTVTDFKAADGRLTFTVSELRTLADPKGNLVTRDLGDRTFVAGPNPAAGGPVRGTLGTDRLAGRAVLAPTDGDDLWPADPSPAARLMRQAQGLANQVALTRNRLRQEKDADRKKELRAEADAAQKAADERVPGLYRAVVGKHPDSPAALDAAVALLRSAEKAKVTPAEAGKLAALVVKQAAPYGPRYSRPAAVELADTLVRSKEFAALALGPIAPVARALTDKDPAATRFDILSTYKAALEAAGKDAEAKSAGEQLDSLDAALDKEYLAAVPPFKVDAHPGRKDPAANRVAVLELFTGAQCPPCVAADVAFDAAQKAYSPADVVLLQYHLHIPGPDPLTNPAAVARWGYYQKLFPYDPAAGTGVIGTPTTVFNGKQEARENGGGGSMEAAAGKFGQYRAALNRLLEQASPVKVSGTATRSGDKLEIAAEVTGAPAGARLRLVVVEETVKYVGSNKVRFHHQVVRAMPGGADGVEVKEGAFRHTAAVDLGEVRKGLVKYLDEYAATERPFPKPDRPLALDKLGVVALVQDDATGEILQAARIGVGGK